ncbi:hypothetical protein HPCPY1662_1428 [Helicobacter pylori CPY1662]|nr:hypothetical protein HPCPY1662_1428 [Helicobacter pylori CPY1662]
MIHTAPTLHISVAKTRRFTKPTDCKNLSIRMRLFYPIL